MSDRPPLDPGTPGEFRHARAIFESALDRPWAERTQLVLQACGDDASLAALVGRMLRADAEYHPLLDGDRAFPVGRWRPGDTFAGHYRIVALIGRGGMGEVYRARDATLGRDVALKVLLPEVAIATDGADDRLARLGREAQVLATLNHPNIATIYGLEEAAGVLALVLEVVEGPTLANRIAEGNIPLEEVVTTARQIASGLEAAHEQGIVHRDLKPANIKLRPDGAVKLLDFGLAKTVPSGVIGRMMIPDSPTISGPSLAQRGVLLGTAAYMSPEQAKGGQADRRSDVWAFGAVLYEMLSGARAFEGQDVSETLAAVLRADVAWSRLPASTPASIRHLLSRCLDRDTTRRLRDIGEARILLDDLKVSPLARSGAYAAVPPVKSPRWRLVALAAVALVTGVGIGAALWPRSGPSALHVTRFTLSTTSGNALLLDPQSRDLSITPDGTRIVYKGGGRVDSNRLFVHTVDELDPKPLTDPGLPKGPFTSPDGQWVGFFEPGPSGAALKKVAITGGPPLRLSQLDGPSRGGTWGDDDSIIVATGAPSTGLQRVPSAGGAPVVLTRPKREQGEADHLWPQFLPGSKGVLFTITALTGGMDAAQIAVLDVASGTWRTLIRGGSQAQYLPSGHLVYVAGGALWAVRFELTDLQTHGTAAVVVPHVVTLPTGTAEFDIARNGTLVYVAGGGAAASPRTLVWVDRQGREESIPGLPERAYSLVRLSPDGTRVALEIKDQQNDIWVWDLARHISTRVTTDPGLDESPVWMPDGRRLVFTSQADGGLGSLFWQAADGGGVAERLTEGKLIQRASAVLADSTKVLFSEGRDLMTLTLDKDRRVLPLVRAPHGGADSVVSPDGRWLAYAGMDSASPQIFVRPYPSTNEGRTQVSTTGGSQPRWSRNSRELFYIGIDGALMSVVVEPGATFTARTPTRVIERPYYSGLTLLNRSGTYDVSADGQRFLRIKQTGDPNQFAAPATMVVVQNWFEELKRRVPTR